VVAADALGDTAAERLTGLIERAIAQRHIARIALTGGTTPRATYEALADEARPWRRRIDWSRVHLFWGDDRHVPPDDPDSNFGMAARALVQHVPVPAGQVHRIRGELADPHQAAAEYARELPDAFDVMLLGLGEDCHVASIFPGSPLMDPGEPWQNSHGPAIKAGPAAIDGHRRGGADLDGRPVTVTALLTPKGWRITVTPLVVLSSRAILMLVSGEHKAAAVAAAIDGPIDVTHCPGQILREVDERVEWVLDTAAAGRLRPTRTSAR